MTHTTGCSWHTFKPKLSGLSQHQPLGRYTWKVRITQGWTVKLREPRLGPASAQHSLRVVSEAICYPIRDREMAPVEP